MFIVDTHVHTTDSDMALPPPIVPHQDEITQTAGDHVLAMDRAGIDAGWLVQWSSRNVDLGYEADAADRFPDRFVAVYAPDVTAPDAVAQLRAWFRRRVLGIRLFHNFTSARFPEPLRVDDPQSTALIECAGEARRTVMICAPHTHLSEIEHLFERYRDIRFILDHLAMATEAGPLLAYARHPNLQIKFSTGPLSGSEHWAGEGDRVTWQRHMMRELVSAYGAERLLWGTDYPNSHVLTLSGMVDWSREILDFVSADDFARMMGGNALDHWQFETVPA